MNGKNLLIGKRVLIVDDEPDVLSTLTELLDVCKIETASSFEEGKRLLEEQMYDIAILDIMGVEGFELLEVSKARNVPALMLTAAPSEERLNQSAKEGAAYFVPKDKMIEIDIFVGDVLAAIEQNKSTWEKWFSRLGNFFDKRFNGPDWREQEKKFWEKKTKIPW
jgi:DNA-binding response OmpR family regulator